jgi:predicted transcriptional regulator
MVRKKQIHKNPRLTIVLSPHVYEELWKLADTNDVPAAWIIRRAVEHYLGHDKKGSVQVMAGEKTALPPRRRQPGHPVLHHY